MRNIRVAISYDGTRYHGFQIQPSVPSVQAAVQEAIASITGENITVHGSGRTDAGVHAREQVVNFMTASRIPIERWCHALNTRLPSDIVAWSAEEVPETFHARKSSKRKTYCYTINGNRFPDPLLRHMELHHPGPLEIGAMREAVRFFQGEHDFTSFCSVKTESESKIRTIYEARLECGPVPGMETVPGTGRIQIYFSGNGFLYNMVRIMVGTLIAVGEGKIGPAELQNIMEARNRDVAGVTAPAHGLSLWSVAYD